MTDLTPPPPPFNEGGPPQSGIAPGDGTRELIHEIRNLNQQVRLLHTVFVRRKVLFNYLMIELCTILLVLGALFYLVNSEHQANNQLRRDNLVLVNKIIGSCETRNIQTAGTQRLIARILSINTEQFNSIPAVQRTPFINHVEGEYVSALKDWQQSLPTPVNCSSFR